LRIAAAEALHGHVGRGVAVDAGAGLFGGLLALGEGLILEHVAVAALLAEVDREGVAGPQGLEARVLLQLRPGHHRPRIDLRGRALHRLAAAVAGPLHVDGALVAVVLEREVLSPDGWIFGVVVQLDDAEKRVLGLLLLLEDRDEEPHEDRRCDGDGRRDADGSKLRALFVISGH
jgi:hypothetical protein